MQGAFVSDHSLTPQPAYAEWGYFIGHGPDPEAPSIVSRLLDTEYTGKICRLAFPDGKLNSTSARMSAR